LSSHIAKSEQNAVKNNNDQDQVDTKNAQPKFQKITSNSLYNTSKIHLLFFFNLVIISKISKRAFSKKTF